jgi:hypothetical protein
LPSISINDFIEVAQTVAGKGLGFLDMVKGASRTRSRFAPFAMHVLKKDVAAHATKPIALAASGPQQLWWESVQLTCGTNTSEGLVPAQSRECELVARKPVL